MAGLNRYATLTLSANALLASLHRASWVRMIMMVRMVRMVRMIRMIRMVMMVMMVKMIGMTGLKRYATLTLGANAGR